MGIIKEEWIGSVSTFLTQNMGFFFVPPGVALMLHFGIIRNELAAIVVSVLVSTILVMVTTGWTHQMLRRFMIHLKRKK